MTGTAILLTADAGISSAFTTVFNKLGLHPIVLNEETAFFSLLSNISPLFICFDTYVCSNSP
ncbi:MAG: hypothetical protein JXR91_09375, partial [Deltaproteobacteria bacterium]|nr:hypothetical protein [Deltaproteobacteria bacterium]